jgi:chemotaxis protein methyltransferase CheR
MIQSQDYQLIDRFRDAIALRLGLQFDDGKRDFLAEVLTAQTGLLPASDAAYVARLRAGQATPAETAALAADLTVGETYFYRHPDQFRSLAAALQDWPPSGRRRFHVLSAGCASGEEAYSLAILLRESLSELSGWDLRVVGIDLNPAALAKAERGRYTAWSLRGLSEDLRHRYFRPAGKEYLLDPYVLSTVTFEQRNLLDDDPDFWRPVAYDAVFCRNVLMYLTPEASRAVVARLTRSLAPGGFLFLGPAETLRGLSNGYHLRHTHDTFYYQRRADGEAGSALSAEQMGASGAVDAFLPALAGDDSWVTAISQASERIARLSRGLRLPLPLDRRHESPRGGGASAGVSSAPPDTSTALEMVRQERYGDALVALGATRGGRDVDAQLLRAVVLTNSGRVAEAEPLCHDILAGDELNAEARYLLALCREHAGAYPEAAEQDRTAIYLDPQFAMPHLHLGLLGKRTGDREGAQRAFRHALTLFPGEDAGRVLLFGGGFSRDMLVRLCEAEWRLCGGNQ